MPGNNKWTFILGSSSPRRRELLGHTGVPFEVRVAGTDEISHEREPAKFVLEIARQKSSALVDGMPEHSVLVCADTTVSMDGEIYGKPDDINHARRMLKTFSGKTHQVHTAVVIIVKDKSVREWSWVEKTDVDFLSITDYALEHYLQSGQCMDKAGAYGIQGEAMGFVTGVHGCYANVVGFPLARFNLMMQNELSQALGWSGPWQKYF